jgi:hypothetical protein
VVASIIATIIALYPQPATSELLWRVPYDNQSRAAGPVGIGYPPQQIASQYNELNNELNEELNEEQRTPTQSPNCDNQKTSQTNDSFPLPEILL